MEKYNPVKIESKWQKYWEDHPELYSAKEKDGQKAYILDMFPYPSADGLHTGHVESYTATDIISRYLRMAGKNVLHPQGFDAFGLPAENFAIKTKTHPSITTRRAIVNFKQQMNMMGLSYDWSRMVDTSNPEYYKWTQWFFLLLYKNGLAYKSKAKVNWCHKCQTVLANEQAEGGVCERCGTQVIQKDLEQWFFKITDFIEDKNNTSGLISGLDKIDWPEHTKIAQKNWIGKSEGAQFKMKFEDSDLEIEVFTTRLDTVFGMTYAVIAPEHEIIKNLESRITNYDEVKKYIEEAKKRSELQRMTDEKEKTGVELKGVKLINPFDNEAIPVFVGDYVLGHYGTGAVMAVPAHDERDYKFAEKHNLPIRPVIFKQAPESRSFVMGLDEDSLKGIGIEITGKTKEGFLKIKIPFSELEQYKDLVKEKMQPGFWNEFSTNKGFYFIFKHKDGRLEEMELNEKTNDLIDKYGATFNDETPPEKPRNVYMWPSWLADGFFYQELLIHTDDGILINSVDYNGLTSEQAREKLTQWLEKNKLGSRKINYKLRDWLVSRQRYWGAPIPIIYCEKCAAKKEQVLFLHGWEDDSQSGIIPELKKNLEGKGYDFYAFDAPNTMEPQFEEWFSFIEGKIKENKLRNFHLIGHSMGGHLAAKIAEKYQVKSLYLFAPVGFNPSDKYFDQFNDKLGANGVKIFKKYQQRKLDADKVRINSGEINIIFGENDPWITKEIRDFYINNFKDCAHIHILSGYGHMSKDERVKKLPFFENLFSVSRPGVISVPGKDLPVLLPDDVDFMPHGESPLARSKKFHDVKCPVCGEKARRESDTMDTFVCSSWYYFRYADPHNEKEFASKEQIKKWLPVDLYVGGAEHTVLHLLYSRFFTKVLHNLGYIDFDEPFLKMRHQGIIIAEDGRKMSKSFGNVVNPTDIVVQYGADTLRLFEMFMGPLEDSKKWDTKGIMGVYRFLEKIWKLKSEVKISNVKSNPKSQVQNLLHKTIKKVAEDIEAPRFNTAISAMMILVNGFMKEEEISQNDFEIFLKILSPFAPHIAEELWAQLGHKESIFMEKWPEYDPALVKDEMVILVIQINGKVRDKIEVPADISEDDAKSKALASEKIKYILSGEEPKKVIFARGMLVNIVL